MLYSHLFTVHIVLCKLLNAFNVINEGQITVQI